MSQNSSSDSVENAVEIIDRFGGIRPMATKLGVPVTTVQGWKKRDTIPADRVDDVVSTAQKLNIELGDLVGANNNVKSEHPKQEPKKETPKKAAAVKSKPEASRQDDVEILSAEDIRREESRNTKHYVWAAVGVVVLLVLFSLFTFSDTSTEVTQNQTRLQALEAEVGTLGDRVEGVEQRTSILDALVPNDLNQRLEVFQAQTNQLTAKVNDYGERFNNFTEELAKNNPETNAQIANLVERVNTLSERVSNGQALSTEIAALRALVQENDIELSELYNAYTAHAVRTEEKINELGGSVTGADIRAATMLIALTQLRDSFNRQTPFEQDLAMLRKLAGPEDEAVQAAITNLSPYAREGVLSVGGLQEQLKLIGNDIVSASLKGEDVSITEKALARLNSIVSVKKDGQAVVGTDTQKLVSQAQTELDKGNVAGAIAILQQLDGQAAQEAQPFIRDAQGTLLANQLQSQIGRSLINKLQMLSTGAGSAANRPVFIQPSPEAAPQPVPAQPQTTTDEAPQAE